MEAKQIFENIDLNDYNYHLPKEKIALFPAKHRNESKLIFASPTSKNIQHYQFSDIIELIADNALLVINNTKVIAARIPAHKITGGKAEILCTNPTYPSHDPQVTMQSHTTCRWKAILGGKAIRPETILLPVMTDDSIEITAKVISKNGMEGEVEFNWEPAYISFADILEKVGKIPLPPYIDRENVTSDKERYQTVYAKNDGSVAAPTAGLHFTNEILEALDKKGVEQCLMTLHVGPGTFRPVSEDDVSKHDMHKEQIIVHQNEIKQLIQAYTNNRQVLAVGTTSLRSLETLYRIGINLFNNDTSNFHFDEAVPYFTLNQWEPYNQKTPLPSLIDAFTALYQFLEEKALPVIVGYTQLFIVPGYDIKTINGIITNFHLPKSTLIMLVAAFCGNDFWKEIYANAMENGYNFLSYGDSSFILKE